MIFDLLHLAGSIVVCGHAAALFPDLNSSGLEKAVPDRPLGHVSSAVAADLNLDVSRTRQVKMSNSYCRPCDDAGNSPSTPSAAVRLSVTTVSTLVGALVLTSGFL